jgi:hypothetical protein
VSFNRFPALGRPSGASFLVQHLKTAGSVIVGEWPGLDGLKEATDGTVKELGLAGPFPATQNNRQNMVEQPWAKANGVSPWLTA